jgi:ArsR family transcriptional regulator, arsenate/arsenite/antimonite-responsive transcriptional repressor
MPDLAAPTLLRSARVFQALSDETRIAIVDRLRGGERCVCDLQDLLEASQSRLSFHLKCLKEAGLVVDRKDGRWSYYSLVPGALEEAVGALVDVKESALRVLPNTECCG